MTATIIPLARRARPVPTDLQPVFALLATITDADLRRYCLDQLAAARDRAEVDAAFSLTRALAQGAGLERGFGTDGAADQEEPPGRATAPPPRAVADIGQGPDDDGRAILTRPRRRKARCTATSSSP